MILEILIAASSLADGMARMRNWLDHNHCEPVRFETSTDEAGAVLIRVEFADGTDAAAFRTAFAEDSDQTQAAAAWW